MKLDGLADELSWQSGGHLLNEVDSVFVADAATAIEETLTDDIGELWNALSEAGRRRVFLAPESTRRYLCQSSADPSFVIAAVQTEAMLEGLIGPAAETRWAALGDRAVLPDGTVARWPELTSPLPMDFGSPWATDIDLSGATEHNRRSRAAFTEAEIRDAARRLDSAMTLIGDTSETLFEFTTRATNVLILQIDEDAPETISSGTTGQYIGRTFITNPHHDNATPDCLAEAIVHEAIHGFLYRHQRLRSWTSAPEEPAVKSAWTGRPLPVRAFLEATFVWYGLTHLWADVLSAGTCDAATVLPRLSRAASGFTRGALCDRLRSYVDKIEPDVLLQVDEVQSRILEAFGG